MSWLDVKLIPQTNKQMSFKGRRRGGERKFRKKTHGNNLFIRTLYGDIAKTEGSQAVTTYGPLLCNRVNGNLQDIKWKYSNINSVLMKTEGERIRFRWVFFPQNLFLFYVLPQASSDPIFPLFSHMLEVTLNVEKLKAAFNI